MRATVLAYGFSDGEARVLRMVCAQMDIRLRRVGPEEAGLPVGAFFGLAPRAEKESAGEDIPGRMLVLAGFGPRQMDAFLSALRTARAPASLKAVLTEHNAAWTGPALYAELEKERAAMGG